ncbi:unnamed protein product [Arabidopsis halleri]
MANLAMSSTEGSSMSLMGNQPPAITIFFSLSLYIYKRFK